ncbi:MAG: GAF domain-containing protein [Sphingomicrobium sp.]
MSDMRLDPVELADDEQLRAILREVCAATKMRFAAIARVTEQQWIACVVEDGVDFGLAPGDELKIRETICDEIRQSGEAVVFDDASSDIKWSRHPVPVLYGFKSYCSFPVHLDDGSFFGTLCALDPARRSVSDDEMFERLTGLAKQAGAILSERLASQSPTIGDASFPVDEAFRGENDQQGASA